MKTKSTITAAIIACLLLCTVIFCGCNEHKPVVFSITYNNENLEPLPDKMCNYCTYIYGKNNDFGWDSFIDSVGKYKLKDTISKK